MFVGIDVAKAELVVSILPSAERFSVANDERGVRTLVERLRGLAPTLIVLSRTMRGWRYVQGGRATVRAVLYMAALVGTTRNAVIRTFYLRLVAAGNAKKDRARCLYAKAADDSERDGSDRAEMVVDTTSDAFIPA